MGAITPRLDLGFATAADRADRTGGLVLIAVFIFDHMIAAEQHRPTRAQHDIWVVGVVWVGCLVHAAHPSSMRYA